MTSSTARSCEPRFPAPGVLLDNSVLVRLWKCQVLEALQGTVELHVAQQVSAEFRKQGPSERAAFDRLGAQSHRVGPGTPFWSAFSRLRGARYNTRDLGDDELLAIAVTWADDGVRLPIVTYDAGAAKDALAEGLVAIDFLDTLAWLVGCGRLTADQANEVERRAQLLEGYRRSTSYSGQIDHVYEARQAELVTRVRR